MQYTTLYDITTGGCSCAPFAWLASGLLGIGLLAFVFFFKSPVRFWLLGFCCS